MRPRFVPSRFVYVRVDAVSAVIVPIAAMVLAVLAGHMILAIGLTKSIYSSPFVALCALVSNRVCLRAGLFTAFLAMVGHEFFFSAPYWSLNWPSPEQGLAYLANYLVAFAVARRVPLPPNAMPSKPDQPLPFVSTIPRTDRCFWSVEPAGNDWVMDSAVGAEYARIYLDQRTIPGPCPALAWIIRDMVKAGRWTGVEAGFASVIERAAAQGHLQPKSVSVPHDDAYDFDAHRSVVQSQH